MSDILPVDKRHRLDDADDDDDTGQAAAAGNDNSDDVADRDNGKQFSDVYHVANRVICCNFVALTYIHT